METTPMTQQTMDEVTIYTDGSSRGNPGPGGFGAILICGQHRKEISQGFQRTTNNRMELLGVIESLKTLKRPCRVTVYSDSTYVVQAIKQNWLSNWKRRNWKTSTNTPVKNVDLWLKLEEQLAIHQVTFKWIQGHAGHPQNERCDELAVAASQNKNLPRDEGFTEDI
jgi:ribonuclease HI